MKTAVRQRRMQARQGEQGYLLIGLLFLLAMMLFFLTMAAPRVFTDLQRDREEEMMHRGRQYTRAIQLYYRKFGRYPSTIAQLENTNNLRFLRKKYVDPMTGKADWKLIGLGQAKTGSVGFFGQLNPLQTPGAAFGSAIGQAGGAGGYGTVNGGQAIGQGGGQGGIFGNNGGSSGFGNSNPGFGSSGSSFGNQNAGSPSPGGSSANGSSGGTDSGTGQPQAGDPSGGTGQAGLQGGATVDSSGGGSSFGGGGSAFGNGGSGFGNSSGSGFGSGSGSAFGSNTANGGNGSMGAPFVGVESQMAKVGVKEFKKKKNYNEWEFLYDPNQEQRGSIGLTGAGSNGTGFGTQNGFGNPVSAPGPGPTFGGQQGNQPQQGPDPSQNPTQGPTPTQPNQSNPQ